MAPIPNSLSELTVSAAAQAIANGSISSVTLVENCLSRITERDKDVQAWTHLDPEDALAQARDFDAREISGPLHGVPIGLKDIIDTANMPTCYGSALFEGNRPTMDALCVVRLRQAGAVILGKTVTTEFAFFAPGKTRNPHNDKHTPGGSSSGSAAAVADFQVPFALGSQTAGSIIRPASFNGVLGFKPSYGMFPLEGVHPLAPSLDTLGFFGRSVDDIALVGKVLASSKFFNGVAQSRPTQAVALVRTPYWSHGNKDMHSTIESFADTLRSQGVQVNAVEAPEFEGLLEIQQSLMAREAAVILGPLAEQDPSKIRPETLRLIEQGNAIPEDFDSDLQKRWTAAQSFVDRTLNSMDVILTPSAPGEAPMGLEATGDPIMNRIWTLCHTPCISFPIGVGNTGLPIGIQLVGKRGHDQSLLDHTKNLASYSNYQITPP